MAGLVPAIPARKALCSPKRDRRDNLREDGASRLKPGDDGGFGGDIYDLEQFHQKLLLDRARRSVRLFAIHWGTFK
jgi:hypothetical protein